MNNKIILIAAISLAFVHNTNAQWVKISGIPTQEIVALASMSDTLYAASGTNRIYKSTDAGYTWHVKPVSIQPIEIFTLEIIDRVIYLGTYQHGVFTSTDLGVTWVHSGSTLPVSGFEKFNNEVYASTVGEGVFKYDTALKDWVAFNNHAPGNMTYNIETIASTANHLIIGGGGNGTFFRYDFVANQWVLGYYYGMLAPGLIIYEIINQSGILFAVNGRRILRSNDGGTNWMEDKEGTQNGLWRNIYLGSHNIYTLTNLLNGGVWIQQRNKHAQAGASWSTNEEFIPRAFGYDIFEFKGKLYLATDDGLYVKDLILDTDHPLDITEGVAMFPNPSNGGNIRFSSTVEVDKIAISNTLGQTVYTEKVVGKDFDIQPNVAKGVYFVTFFLENKQTLTKKIIVE